jgi:hypothetical protein
MMEFFNLLIEAFLWMLVLWFGLQMLGGMFQRHIDTRLEQLNTEIEDIKKVYKRVKIEEHYDCFYIFDVDTDEFLGQGRTAQEFADRLKNNLVLQPVEGDPDVIARFRQTVPQTDLA